MKSITSIDFDIEKEDELVEEKMVAGKNN